MDCCVLLRRQCWVICDVSVQLLWHFPGVSCHFQTCEELGIGWLELHYEA